MGDQICLSRVIFLPASTFKPFLTATLFSGSLRSLFPLSLCLCARSELEWIIIVHHHHMSSAPWSRAKVIHQYLSPRETFSYSCGQRTCLKVDYMEAYLTDPKHIVVLDGGLGTELEARGCNILSPLWSGKALLESPQQIQEVELAYLQAGARCITTSSYQITPQSLMEHAHLTAGAAVALIEESVRIALAARERYLKENPQAAPIFVAGSVGPYGAYLADGSEYRGDYVRSAEEFKEFHRLRIAALLRAGADVLAIETQASAAEVSAIVALLEKEYPHSRAWVSFTTSSTSPAEAISDGTKWEDIIPILETSPQIIAMGVNCIPMSEASAVLAHLHTLTAMPLVVYTNSGESYNPVTKIWHPVAMSDGTSLSLAALAQEWVSHGARLVGGCCRTSPSDIAAAVRALRSAKLLM